MSQHDPLDGVTFTDQASLLSAESKSLIGSIEAPAAALAATADSRVSAIFAIATADSKIKQDAIFSPNGAMNNRWLDISPATTALKLATLKWSNGTAGLVRIGTDNTVYSRYFNGSSWGSWQSLSSFPSGTPQDLAAAVYANGQADIFAVSSDCNIYSRHSTNGQTWGTGWTWWGSCGDKLDVAILPNGTGWAALRVPSVGNFVAVRYFDGVDWAHNTWTYPLGTTAQAVNDVSLLAYSPPVCCAKLTLWAVGTNNSSIYYRNWDGTSWSVWTLWTTGYKQVSSFSTSDGGAYLLFIGANNSLSTEYFTGTEWAGIAPQGGSRTWIATAGVNIDDDTGAAFEHTENSDDCRTQNYTTCFPAPDGSGACFTTNAINLAEVMYNEAQGETVGARAMVGWTVRNRAWQSLNTPLTCGTYPGAEGGGNVTATCRSTVQCTNINYCDNSIRYCCVIHGGQTKLGTSGYQFNDEHVPFNTLYNGGFMWQAIGVINGYLLDMSNPGWRPAGISGCPQTLSCGTVNSGGPWCSPSVNITELPPGGGPMEFRANDYCASTNGAPLSSCKWYAGDVCGNTDLVAPSDPDTNPVEVGLHGACAQTNPIATNDNFFWNRQP